VSLYALRNVDKRFIVHDSTISIWREGTNGANDWETHEAIRMLLVRDGFTFHQDPKTKKNYRCLAKYHHTGKKQDLHFYSNLSGRNHEILFYEDAIRDNQNGGRYHFDKLAKMPYQRRKKAELAIRKVTRLLLSLGFVDASTPKMELAIDRCMQEREELGLFQGDRFYAEPPSIYNSKDRDGNLLRDGQIRYFWDYYGRLGRGVVFHHINNMWWVIASPHTLLNIGSGDFFEWRPGMPLKRPDLRHKRIAKALKAAVENQDFEKAIILRDLVAMEVA
jgi:UvrB/uvrC motif